MPQHLIRNSILALLLVVTLFEIGIRLMPLTPLHPDEMLYTQNVLQKTNSQYVSTTYDLRAAHDQPTITAWYTALNHTPMQWSSFPANCNAMVFLTATIAFRWHGVTIQSWSGGACGNLGVSSGGLPDVWATHTFNLAQPPTQVP